MENKNITDKAGLSHITIYRNFKNKVEIVQYYLKGLFEECDDVFINGYFKSIKLKDLERYLKKTK